MPLVFLRTVLFVLLFVRKPKWICFLFGSKLRDKMGLVMYFVYNFVYVFQMQT